MQLQSNTIWFALATLAIGIGIILMAINLYGLTQSIRKSGLGVNDKDNLRFVPEVVLSYEQSMEAIRRYFKYVRDVENLSLESLREFQWQKVRDMVRFAYAQIPYYRKLFNGHGMRPDDIRSPDDFQRLPLLTKENRTVPFF
jgi:hypothetical protein